MLEFLRIRNLALIDDMTLEFSPGMNVLTGETGAGKTFIIKALNFLLGEKLDANLVRSGSERAQIEAIFQLEQKELVLRRELIAQTGRSRLFINDELHSQEQLKSLREQLVAYTSQHSQQQLLQVSFQEQFFERMLAGQTSLGQRDALVSQLRSISTTRKALEERYAALSEKRDLFDMQLAEIEKVKPEEDEEEQLEAIRNKARASKARREHYDAIAGLLYGDDAPGLLDMLGAFRRMLQALELEDSKLQPVMDTAAAFEQQLSSLSVQMRQPENDNINLDQIEARLFEIAQLKRKLHRTLPEILQLKNDVAENLSFLDSCRLDLAQMQREEENLCRQLQKQLEQIVPVRREEAQRFAGKLEDQLRELGFAKEIKVVPQFVPYPLWKEIEDERVHLLWAPNPGQPLLPLQKIASGGELSRFLLALASLKSEETSMTFIFDEVDAGVGGLTLNKLANKLGELAAQRQILLITHWPQLASRADRHFEVKKNVIDGVTSTTCTQLDPVGRQEELARMAGGGAQGKAYAQSLQ